MVRAVWRNQLGGLTFEVTGQGGRSFLKWAPRGSGLDLSAEASRLRWAGRFVTVPPVLEVGTSEEGCWLHTVALPGTSAVEAPWISRPEVAVRAVGIGLRRLHDALPVADCPFSWSVTDRLAAAQRAEEGGGETLHWHDEHRGLSPKEVRVRLADPPEVDRLVVCHGDPCVPNTLLDGEGRVSGHVDLGALGVADRWADLAVATWSATWNYGPGWDGVLLEAYGVEPDPLRSAYYRLLWDATP